MSFQRRLTLHQTGGITRTLDFGHDGGVTIHTQQEIGDILKINQELANTPRESSRLRPKKNWRLVARIPLALFDIWKKDECIDANNPEDEKKVKRLLNSRAYHKIRTAGGNL